MKTGFYPVVTAITVVVLTQCVFAADDGGKSLNVDSTEISLANEQFKHEMELRLRDIQHENALISAQLERRESDMGNYIDAISWVSGIVIGFVGVLFGIGAFILYRENKDVTSRAQAQLDAWDKEASKLQSRFDQWFRDAKGVYAGELEQLSRIMRLRVILDQENVTADEIYADLSPLFADPHLAYLPIFHKVLSLDIDGDIKRHTEQAIEKIREARDAERAKR